MTYSRTVRARLRLLIEQTDSTPAQVSTSLGHAHSWLLRKLSDSEDPTKRRDIGSDEVDEVLAALEDPTRVPRPLPAGTAAAALFRPVLTAVDVQAIRWLRVTGEAGRSELAGIFAGAEDVIRRLEVQGFVASDAARQTVKLTELGRTSV